MRYKTQQLIETWNEKNVVVAFKFHSMLLLWINQIQIGWPFWRICLSNYFLYHIYYLFCWILPAFTLLHTLSDLSIPSHFCKLKYDLFFSDFQHLQVLAWYDSRMEIWRGSTIMKWILYIGRPDSKLTMPGRMEESTTDLHWTSGRAWGFKLFHGKCVSFLCSAMWNHPISRVYGIK